MPPLSRRAALGGAIGLLGSWGMARAAPLPPTPRNELGPFYRRNAPHQATLVRPDDPGLRLDLAGAVFRTTGERLPNATIELWHADDAGHYDVVGERFRTTLRSGDSADYAVHTIMPGHYPDRVCQHVHFLVRAEGCKPLVTQMYFATDPVFEGDPDRNYTRDHLILSRELVRPVRLARTDAGTVAQARFDLVLEAL